MPSVYKLLSFLHPAHCSICRKYINKYIYICVCVCVKSLLFAIIICTFNNANCVKAALHQLDIKLGGFISALQYLDGEIFVGIVSFSSGQTKSAV